MAGWSGSSSKQNERHCDANNVTALLMPWKIECTPERDVQNEFILDFLKFENHMKHLLVFETNEHH